MSRIRKCITMSAFVALASLSTAVWAGHGNGNHNVAGELSTAEIDGLKYMREEEKLARDTYLDLFDQWGLLVFDNIASSEQKHTDTIEKLLDKYAIDDPVVSEELLGEFTDGHLQELFDTLIALGFQSATDGLVVGAMIEETDIVDIQAQIEAADHQDLVTVYENLMCGSRNHLRAFAGNLELVGFAYEPSLLGDQFWEIANSPMEYCGEK